MKKHLHFTTVFLLFLIFSCATDKIEIEESNRINTSAVWTYNGNNSVLKRVIQELQNGSNRESLERKLSRNEVLWDNAKFTLIDGKKRILVPFLSIDKENIIGVLSLVKNNKNTTIYDMTVRSKLMTKNNKIPFWNNGIWLGYFMALDKDILGVKNGNPGFTSRKNPSKSLTARQVCDTYLVETVHYQYYYTVNSSGEASNYGESEPYSTYEYHSVCYEVPDNPITPTDPNTGGGGTGTNTTITTINNRIINLITDPCTSQVFTKLKNLNNGDIPTMLDRFRADGSIYDLNISTGPVSSSGNEAVTKFGNNNDIIILLNEDYINGTFFTNRPTDLSIANTIAHEIIHAYLLSMLKKNGQILTEQEQKDFQAVCNAYEDYLSTKNPDISVNAQHEYIATSYVNAIAATIKEFHTGSSNYSSTNLNDQVYTDLAWAGLFKTDIFEEKYPDNPNNSNYAERTRIINRFYAERNGQNWGQSVTRGVTCPK